MLEGDGLWLVAFVAPWCGHCKSLEPEWGRVAAELEGQVSFGAVDATAARDVAQRYGVEGYPTIKRFHRGQVADYGGGRDAASIKVEALNLLDSLGVEAEVPQLTGAQQFHAACVARKGTLCALGFLPHILDSQAAGRREYVELLKAVAKKNRATFAFFWSEAGAQPALEESLSPGGMPGYPTLAVVSGEKKRFALMRDAFDAKHAAAFVGGVLRGGTATYPATFGAVAAVEPWDGADGELPEEEPLDDLDDVEVEF